MPTRLRLTLKGQVARQQLRFSRKVNKVLVAVWSWKRISVESFRDCIFGHSICTVGDEVYIFGGKRKGAFTNDLIKLRNKNLDCMEI
jgi:hypothetical protein